MQRNTGIMVFFIILQFHRSIVFNFAVQHTGSHIEFGCGILIHLVGHTRHRMVQAVHMGISRKGYIACRFCLIPRSFRGGTRCF